MAPIEDIAEVVFAEVDTRQGEFDPCHHIQASLRCVGDSCEAVDCADVEGKVGSANASQLGSENQQVGSIKERGKTPGEEQWEAKVFRW